MPKQECESRGVFCMLVILPWLRHMYFPPFSSLLQAPGDWPLWMPSIGSLALWLPVGFSHWEELAEDWKVAEWDQGMYFLGFFSVGLQIDSDWLGSSSCAPAPVISSPVAVTVSAFGNSSSSCLIHLWVVTACYIWILGCFHIPYMLPLM